MSTEDRVKREDRNGIITLAVIMLAAVITVALLLNAVIAIVLLLNTEMHVQDNEQEIRTLIENASLESTGIIKGLPDQGMSIKCREQENDFDSRRATGLTTQVCNLALYGPGAWAKAEYTVMTDYKKKDPGKLFTHVFTRGVEHSLHDAYLDTGSIEISTPKAARIEPREQETPRVLRLPGLEGK